MGICCVFMLPTRGRDSGSFFAHLLSLIYVNSDFDSLYITADFNAKIGTLSNILEDCDTIKERVTLDKSVNQHGHALLEFLK